MCVCVCIALLPNDSFNFVDDYSVLATAAMALLLENQKILEFSSFDELKPWVSFREYEKEI